MFGGIGAQEMLIIGIVAVLLFGKKLPEVAKTVGGSYREFRKGLFDLQSTMNTSVDSAPKKSTTSSYVRDEYDDYEQATAPKFEPPTSAPAETSASADNSTGSS